MFETRFDNYSEVPYSNNMDNSAGNERSHLITPIIIFVLLFFLILGIFLIAIFMRPSQKKDKNVEDVVKTVSPTPIKKTNSNPPEQVVVPSINQTDLLSYESPQFKIQHPKDWGVFYNKFIGGEEYTIKPFTLDAVETVPSIQIEVFEGTSSAVLDTWKTRLKSAKFQEEQTVFQNISATKLSGVVEFKPKIDGIISTPYLQTVYFFFKSNNNYIVIYSYDGNAKNSRFEDFFKQILGTLVIK